MEQPEEAKSEISPTLQIAKAMLLTAVRGNAFRQRFLKF
jgi:hypothetical protein